LNLIQDLKFIAIIFVKIMIQN